MMMCSPIHRDSNPSASAVLATSTTGAPYQVTLVAIPIFMTGPGRSAAWPNFDVAEHRAFGGRLEDVHREHSGYIAHGIEPRQLIGAELDIERAEIVLELGDGAYSDHRGGHRRIDQRPGNRDLSRCFAELLGDLADHLCDRQVALGYASGDRVDRLARAEVLHVRRNEVCLRVLARKHAAAEGGPGADAHAHLRRHRDHLPLYGAFGEAIGNLQGAELAPPPELGNRLHARGLPGRNVGQADVENLARPHE